MNASNNDNWVGDPGRFLTNFIGMVFGFPPRGGGGARHETRLQKQTKFTKQIPTEIPDFSTKAHHSTSQILRTFLKFSEAFLGRETPREDHLGSGRIPYYRQFRGIRRNPGMFQ